MPTVTPWRTPKSRQTSAQNDHHRVFGPFVRQTADERVGHNMGPPRGLGELRRAPGLLDALGNAGYPIGLLKELGEFVRLHLLEAHEDELR